MTKNANMILEIVSGSNEHLTAEQIFLRMKEITGKISLATVYNNLSFLHQQGLIRKLTLGDGPERYDRPVRHDHMICRDAQAVGYHAAGYDERNRRIHRGLYRIL